MQFILDGFDEGFPAGFDDVLVNTDRGPGFLLILEFGENADLRGGPGLGINNADFIIRQADLGDGGKTFQFLHLPVGKYDLVLVAAGAVFEGLALGDPPDNPDPMSAQNLRTRIGAADSFFNRFAIHRTGLGGDQALAFVERVRDRLTLKQSGEKLDANLRRFEIIELTKAADDWQMATTRHIYREEETGNTAFLKHFFVSAIGNLRVVDTVKQLGTLALPPN
jgi:hypothetical protein